MYEVPPFFKDYVLSNDMIFIIIKLINQSPEFRFPNLKVIKEKLMVLKENILSTPL